MSPRRKADRESSHRESGRLLLWSALGIKNELPGLVQQMASDRKIISKEAAGVLELLTLFVGAFQHDAMERAAVFSLVGENAGGQGTVAEHLDRLIAAGLGRSLGGYFVNRGGGAHKNVGKMKKGPMVARPSWECKSSMVARFRELSRLIGADRWDRHMREVGRNCFGDCATECNEQLAVFLRCGREQV